MRISLAQYRALACRTRPGAEAALTDVPKEFTPAELERWSMTSDTAAGRLHHLGPVVRLSETPPPGPRCPLGYNEPVWPARAT